LVSPLISCWESADARASSAPTTTSISDLSMGLVVRSPETVADSNFDLSGCKSIFVGYGRSLARLKEVYQTTLSVESTQASHSYKSTT
jgi:hypothetical protein